MKGIVTRSVLFAAAISVAGAAGMAQAQDTQCAAHPEKIGIGTGLWGADAQTASHDLDRTGLAWYYTWTRVPPAGMAPGRAAFVPMVWGPTEAGEAALAEIDRSAPALLSFNEPDNETQSNMTVDEAVALWPAMERLNMRLGSPAPSSNSPDPISHVTGDDSWLSRFMTVVDEKHLRVDFIAMHYYTVDPDPNVMAADLEKVHARYGRPIWVTEWGLVDFTQPDRFTQAETAAFLLAATKAMDALPFVERHAWFAMYAGGDGWHINTQLVDGGDLTEGGKALSAFACAADLARPHEADSP